MGVIEDSTRMTGNLTEEQAQEFAELGVPEMREKVGRPVGITPEQYLRYLEGGKGYTGPDMKSHLQQLFAESP